MRASKFLLAGVATVALTGAALAADLPTRKGAAPAPYMQPVAAFTWTGPYLGAFAGGNWSSVRSTDTSFGGVGIPNLNTNGLTAGGLAGWNWGFNGFIIGAEAEAGYDHRSGSAGYTAFGAPMNISAYGAAEGRLRGRLGWGWDRWMAFVAGGGSVTDLRITSGMPGFGSQEMSRWRAGFNVGGGVEWAFSDHWTVRGEYIYDWYGNRNYNFNAQNAAFDNVSVRTRESTARAVLSYKF